MSLKKNILLTFTLLFSLHSLAQQKTALVGTDQKTAKLFFEKAYLQIDRNYYHTGEDVWFSAYLVNGKSTSLTSTSNNLYVELVSPATEIIDRKIIRMDNGLGKGDFILKDSLSTGFYQIRAYTNWMRNFGNDFVFQKKIFINSNTAKKASANQGQDEKKETTAGSKKSIAFFPEGGALVESLPSLIAFKTNDDHGDGVKAVGNVISSKGDTVAAFQSTEIGMGIFAFTPKADEKYRVEGFYGQEKFTAEMPLILKKGLTLHVVADSATIRASISANVPSFNELKDKSISIVIKHAGDKVYTGEIKLTKSSVSVSIPTKDIPKGIAVITLLDDVGRPNCERLVFIQGENKVNFTVKANKPIYRSREKVILTVKAADSFGQPVKTSLSLAAVDGIIPDDGDNLVSYFLLQSEVKGEIKNAGQYFDSSNLVRIKQLDLLLLTQGWRDYLWKKLADSVLNIRYLPEPGLTIQGLVREKLADKPMPGMNIALFGSNFIGDKLFTTKTDQNGRYYLDGLKWYGNQAIKISSQNNEGKKGGWLQIDSVFNPIALNFKKENQNDFPIALKQEMDKRSAYNNTFKFGDSIKLNDVEINANKKKIVLFDENLTSFGYPDQVFNISAADYGYNGLEHFLLTKANGAFPVDDADTSGNEGVTFISNGKKIRPRVLINNRQDLFDRLDYYSLTMDQINQVIVKHMVNNSGADVYVISLNLKDSALRGPNLNLLNINLNGYYQARLFYAPNYNISASQNKDLRTTLYWNPSIKTNEQGEATISYFNGDNKGNVIIKTDGITDKGIAVSAKGAYKIQ